MRRKCAGLPLAADILCAVLVVGSGSAQLYPSLAKDCWDAAEPFRRSPLRRYPNGTAVDSSQRSQVEEPIRLGSPQQSKMRLSLDSDSYKIVTLSSDEPFEAFVITIAATTTARDSQNSNAPTNRPSYPREDPVWPGNFVRPADSEDGGTTSVMLTCGDQLNSGVGSGPQRGDYRNVRVSWFAPDQDVGPVFFKVAILRGNLFWTDETARLQFFPFPPPTEGCGTREFCLRQCDKPITNCPSYTAEYVYMQSKWRGSESTIVVTMGGLVPEENRLIAMGYTADKDQLTNSDLTVCARPFVNSTTGPSNRPLLQHFLMEKIEYGPKPSGMNEGGSSFRLDRSSLVDRDQIWCKFTRPVSGSSRQTLDLRRPLYRFFFLGSRNKRGEIMIPDKSALLMSEIKYNVSRVADILYFRSSACLTRMPQHKTWSVVVHACALVAIVRLVTAS